MDKYDIIWIGVIILIIYTFGFIAGYAIKGCPVDLSCNKWNLYNQNFSSLFCNKTNISEGIQWINNFSIDKKDICYVDFGQENISMKGHITECEWASECVINNTAIGCQKIDCNWCCFGKYGMSTCTLMGCGYYQGD